MNFSLWLKDHLKYSEIWGLKSKMPTFLWLRNSVQSFHNIFYYLNIVMIEQILQFRILSYFYNIRIVDQIVHCS